MKVSKEQAEKNRQEVIASAARLFRDRGFDGIGLSEVMQAAGLTHGGFYKNFDSKEDLVRQAAERALSRGRARWTHEVAGARGDALASFVRGYLSPEHRDRVADGCAFVALGADAARRGDARLREIFEAEARGYLDLLDGILSAEPGEVTRDASIAILSTMVGGLLMARLMQDPALSARFLRAAADAALALGHPAEDGARAAGAAS
ncbi:TetR/AcrR family transcriptional regulator [Thiomonas sp.]|jgi:TetR/AcrR family transcriptional repressor of nem operon|uniref:TetR/AcrR family transcriptional regulator n=1 Tax=Thiomonas sp. TaxID=2047785 RepID=UPI0026075EBA|nr:TetR/AcrR family transcriptional regulator [Thiomonas sp.]